ncbi:MAG: zinc-dependent metalloprotease family protein, partial [Casimicrobiaceae bacterium]
IIANNDLITYAGDNLSCNGACTANKDPYSNGNGSMMLNQNQNNIDKVIGSVNYDIGHVFSTGGGGIAQLAVPCGNSKAKGVTGLSNPVGDPFAIDYVAHEMGHQWGANHTFNGTVSSCGGGNRSNTSAYEPGSAITIMGYAGICGNQDLAGHSIDTFHVKSLEAIVAYSQTGAGNNCAAATATGNTAPAVTGPGNFTIPKQTPFSLTAIAIDDNGATFTYDWEEYDLDAGNSGTTAVPNTDADGTARPIFRPYSPSLSGTRIFPSLPYILNNANVPPASTADGFLIGELLPAISRAMTFKVVARDNRANGGGINTATSTITINGASGPFVVTSPNTNVTVLALTPYNVTWNVAGTAGAPVSAANVRILLSTDGGQTFPIVLAASTPNDGAQTVFFPNLATTTARVRVEAIGNIFFDISDANFAITVNSLVPTLDVDASGTSSPYDALTDGVLLIRYLFGVAGAPLTAGALGSTATRTDPADIKNYLDAIYPVLDVDGDGSVDPATDGLLIVRYLFGLRGDALIAGALGAMPSRSMPMDIEHYIQSLMP